MDDERKKTPPARSFKAGGKKNGGPRGGKPVKDGKPAFAKPFRGGKKPFVRRDDDGVTASGKPRRDFRRDEKGAGDAAKPRFHAKAGTFRNSERQAEGERPFRSAGKPFIKREDNAVAGSGKPRRDFRRDENNAGDGAKPRFRPKTGTFRTDERQTGGERSFRSKAGSVEGCSEKSPRPGRRERQDMERNEQPGGFSRPRREHFGKDRPGKDIAFPARGLEGGETVEGERIARRLARAGIASRRDAETLIGAGRIKVNGKVLTSPAFNVMPDDRIELDGTLIPPIERTRLFLFHKPAGLVTTNRDPEGRRTVFDALPQGLPRLMTVGRLDINTEGLLLLTNDGGLARVLELPATGWLRRYRARVHGKVDEQILAGLKDGIAVGGVFYGSVEASLDREQGTNAWLTIGLREGKNREVKNILGALGLEVTRLIRVSYGPFQLGELPEGAVQELKGKMLRDQLGERLIEEAGANFEAPIARPFSNRPVKADSEGRESGHAHSQNERDGMAGAIGEGGLVKMHKRRERGREDALSRLSTTRPDFDKKTGRGASRPPKEGDEKKQRVIEPPGGRKANVWMAPGARPQGKGRLEAEARKAEADRKRKPRSQPGDARPAGRRKGKDDADRRR